MIIYHKNCYDGYTAAHIVKKRFPESRMIPSSYGDDLPEVYLGDTVYIVDFSFPPEMIEDLCRMAVNVYVYDHHKSAIERLEYLKIDNLHMVLDVDRSGAQITWDELYPDQEYPVLVAYTADRDLWKWELPNSKEINRFIRLFKMSDFEALEWNLENQLFNCVATGAILLRQSEKEVGFSCRNRRILNWGEHKVSVLNASHYISETGNRLASTDEVDFAAIWYIRSDGMVQWGLRSVGDNDVSSIAKKHGGGGHKNAAGFTLSLCQSLGLITDVTRRDD